MNNVEIKVQLKASRGTLEREEVIANNFPKLCQYFKF